MIVRAVAGSGVPALQTTSEYAGSLTERAILSSGPLTVVDPNPDAATEASTAGEGASSTIALPLGSEDGRIGALMVDAAPVRYAADHMSWAVTFGHLAALAYEKVRLIEEAREGRRELERVMRSHQRLIRGFSHDVKNPLGASEGYAELLSLGLYGELSAGTARKYSAHAQLDPRRAGLDRRVARTVSRRDRQRRRCDAIR